jgi:serine/threonine protein kinase
MLVIEYLENGSLDDLISNGGKLSREDVIQIALDVAEGLHYLHSQKIIHRDLKSANVLVCRVDNQSSIIILNRYSSCMATKSEPSYLTSEPSEYLIKVRKQQR